MLQTNVVGKITTYISYSKTFSKICGLSGSTTFVHIISQRAGFLQKKELNIKFVFQSSPQRMSKTFLILRRKKRERDRERERERERHDKKSMLLFV